MNPKERINDALCNHNRRELQGENQKLRQIIRDVQIFLGTDDCDWDELRSVEDRIKELGLSTR